MAKYNADKYFLCLGLGYTHIYCRFNLHVTINWRLIHIPYLFVSQGNIALGGAAAKPFDWLSDKAWLDCVKLEKLPKFEQLIESMMEHTLLWKAWIQSDTPEEMTYPPPYGDKNALLPFQRLMLLR